jgi:hypothetical protein
MLQVRMWIQIHSPGLLINFFRSQVPSNLDRRRWKAEKRGDGKMKHQIMGKPGLIEFSKLGPIDLVEEEWKAEEEEMESRRRGDGKLTTLGDSLSI